jgi:hypothetical protein
MTALGARLNKMSLASPFRQRALSDERIYDRERCTVPEGCRQGQGRLNRREGSGGAEGQAGEPTDSETGAD